MMDVWWANMKCPHCNKTIRDIDLNTRSDEFTRELCVSYPPSRPVFLPCYHRLPLDMLISLTVDMRTGITRSIELVTA